MLTNADSVYMIANKKINIKNQEMRHGVQIFLVSHDDDPRGGGLGVAG